MTGMHNPEEEYAEHEPACQCIIIIIRNPSSMGWRTEQHPTRDPQCVQGAWCIWLITRSVTWLIGLFYLRS